MKAFPIALLTFIAVFSVVMLSDVSDAEDPGYITEGDFEYIVTSPTTVTVIDYFNNEEADVVIPAVVPGTTYNVTALDLSFYQECIHTITIPSSVESIENYCFPAPNLTTISVAGGTHYSSVDGILFNYNQSKLLKYPCGKTDTDYTVPDSVVEIGAFSFENSNVHNVITKSGLVIIGNCAFYNASSLKQIAIPEESSLTMIGNNAFYNTGLTSINLTWELSFIGSFAFQNTALETVYIPSNIEHIGEGAFAGCKSLKTFTSSGNTYTVIDDVLCHTFNNIKTLAAYPGGKEGVKYTIPADISSIEPYAFYGTANLKEVVLDEKLTLIPEMAFYGCDSLETINFSKVSIIENMAFDGCIRLTDVTFSDNLTYIGQASFSNTGIETVEIPSTVTFIGVGAFSSCSKLKSFTIVESSKATIGPSAFIASYNLKNISIYSKDVILDADSLSVGTSEDLKCTVDLLVPSGYSVPQGAADEFTTLNISYIGERPYPYENIIGAVFCLIVIIGILYAVRQV